MRTLLTPLGVAMVLFLSGCGTNHSETSINTLPQEIKLEKRSLLTQQKVDQNETGQEYGQAILQKHLEVVNETQKCLKVNLLFVQRLFKEVQSYCEGRALGTPCKIASDSLTVVLDESLLKAIHEIGARPFTKEGFPKLNDTLSFGEIIYVEYDKTAQYQYDLRINSRKTDKFLGKESVDSLTQVKWSKDKQKVHKMYQFNDGNLTNTLTLDYHQHGEEEQKVTIENKVKSIAGDSLKHCYLNFHDVNGSLNTLGMIQTDEYFTVTSRVYLLGELSQEKSYLNLFGKVNEIDFEEDQVFDNDGFFISSKFCHTNLECDLSDKSTWLTR